MVEQLIFTDVAAVAGVPIPYLTLNTVGPTIMRYGTDEQKDYFLPKILAGDLHFSIGYSEPGSGTDLASLRTRAVQEGDEWVINGQKMWTSLIQYADWIWMACRTDPDLPRHKGLSMILVPADAAGFSYTPVHTVAGVAHQRHLLRGRARPGRQPGRRAQRRLVADDQPAQPRTRGPHVRRAADALAGAGRRVGARRPRTPTASASSTASGCRCCWAGRTPASRCSSSSTGSIASSDDDLSPAVRQRDEGLRLRAGHRGLPVADGGRRAARRGLRRLPRRGHRGPARALPPLLAGDDVRWRHQRDPARHHRLRRARPAGREADRDPHEWTSTSPPRRTRRPAWPRGSSRTGRLRSGCVPSRPDGDRFDHELWQDLADAGLLGLAIAGGVRRRRTRPRRAVPRRRRGRPHRRAGAGRDAHGLRARARRARHRRAARAAGCTAPPRASG